MLNYFLYPEMSYTQVMKIAAGGLRVVENMVCMPEYPHVIFDSARFTNLAPICLRGA